MSFAHEYDAWHQKTFDAAPPIAEILARGTARSAGRGRSETPTITYCSPHTRAHHLR